MKPAPTKTTRGMDIVSRGFGIRKADGLLHLYMWDAGKRSWYHKLTLKPEQARDLANAAALACGPT